MSVSDPARRDVAGHLGQSTRRLRQADNDEELYLTLAGALEPLAGRTAVLRIAAAGILAANHPPIPLSAAPAVACAVESLDCVVAMHRPEELSAELAGLLPAAPGSRVMLVPVVSGGTAPAVLYAEDGARTVESGPLEVLATVAGLVLDTRTVRSRPAEVLPIVGERS